MSRYVPFSLEELLVWIVIAAGLAVVSVVIILIIVVMVNIMRDTFAQLAARVRTWTANEPSETRHQTRNSSGTVDKIATSSTARPTEPKAPLPRAYEPAGMTGKLGAEALKPAHLPLHELSSKDEASRAESTAAPPPAQAPARLQRPPEEPSVESPRMKLADDPTYEEAPASTTTHPYVGASYRQLEGKLDGALKRVDATAERVETVSQRTQALEKHAATVTRQMKTLEARVTQALRREIGQFDPRLAAVEGNLEALRHATSEFATAAADTASLSSRLAATERRLDDVDQFRTQVVEGAQRLDRIEKIAPRIADLERRLVNLKKVDTQLAGIQRRLDDLEKVHAQLADFNQRLDDLGKVHAQLGTVAQHLDLLEKIGTQVATVMRRLDNLERGSGKQNGIAAMQQAHAALEARVASVEHALTRGGKESWGGRSIVPAHDPDWSRVVHLIEPLATDSAAAGSGRLSRVLRSSSLLAEEARIFILVAQCLTGRLEPSGPDPMALCRANGSDRPTILRAEKVLKALLSGELAALSRMRQHLLGRDIATPVSLLEAEALRRLVHAVPAEPRGANAISSSGYGLEPRASGSGWSATEFLEEAVDRGQEGLNAVTAQGAGNIESAGTLDLDHLVETILRRVVIPYLSKILYLAYACPVERLGDRDDGHTASARLIEYVASNSNGQGTLAVSPDHLGTAADELLHAMGWESVTVLPYRHTLDEVRTWADTMLVEPRIYFEPLKNLVPHPLAGHASFADCVARVDVPLLHAEDRSRATSPKYGVVRR